MEGRGGDVVTINERIAMCIEKSGLTKTAFAERINLSQPHVSKLANGTSAPSDRTIADICREFGISETWLRTGEGAMIVPTDRDAEIAAFFGDVLRGEQIDFRRRFVAALAKLDEKGWALLEAMANMLIGEMQR